MAKALFALAALSLASCSHQGAGSSVANRPATAAKPARVMEPLGPAVVSNKTLTGLLVMGYQGWFAYPGSSPGMTQWQHWSHKETPDPDNITFDMWPDLSEYAPEELSDTTFHYPDGRVAGLYSAANPATVDRHMRWAKEYGIDGVFLQRFLVSVTRDRTQRMFRDQVARNIIASAKNHGRVFAIEYDFSGADEEHYAEQVMADWQYLVDVLKVTAGDRYLWHRGRPLLILWGFGSPNRPGDPATLNALMDWFTRDAPERYRVTLAGGIPSRWRAQTGLTHTGPEWAKIFRRFSVIHPWHVNRYKNEAERAAFFKSVIEPDLVEARRLGIDYLPVLWPGFSWTHKKHDHNPAHLNVVPRRGGAFWWSQFHALHELGCDMFFGAMFDEVDEATAMYKIAATKAETPDETQFLSLDADGLKMSSDFYLRLAGAAGKVLRKEAPPTAHVPIPLEP